MADNNDDFHFAEDYPLQPLEDDCKLLGSLLDDCLKIEIGEHLFQKLERIRALSDCATRLSAANDTQGAKQLSSRLADELTALPVHEALPILRAFGHYLNLTSIAETHHSVRTSRMDGSRIRSLDEVFTGLIEKGITPDELFETVCKQNVEIVLTAHPTQVNRRSLQHKFTRIAQLLQQNDRKDLTLEEKAATIEDLEREITALWQTDELRRRKPTPLDEARGGLHIVEQSLWATVPLHLRRMSAALKKHTGRDLPMAACPLRFGSWMGGDRDGNPNVTAKVTHDVSCLSRWMAADLYLKEIEALRFELSMMHANDEVWKLTHEIAARHAAEEQQHNHYNYNHQHTYDTLQYANNSANLMGSMATLNLGTTAAADGDRKSGAESGLFRGPSVAVNQKELASMLSQRHHHTTSAGGLNLSQDGILSPSVMSPTHGSSPKEGGGGFFFSPPLSPESSTDNLALHNGTGMKGSGGLFGKSPPGSAKGGNSNNSNSSSSGALLPQLSTGSLSKMTRGAAGGGGGGGGGGSSRKISDEALKRRGMQAARFHKTSIDNLLHPKAAGATPYRVVLGDVRDKLLNTRRRMEDLLSDQIPDENAAWYNTEEDFLKPLLACYWSLWETGGGIIAEGRLLDLLRRIYIFGLSLMKMDLRQESTRHSDALDEVTKLLGLGSYNEWSEEKRVEWLSAELASQRPLIPPNMKFSDEAREVVDTCKTAAELGRQCLAAYVISMATRASDVLAVELLQREAGVMVLTDAGVRSNSIKLSQPLRVAPLFETLADLNAAGAIMDSLLSNPWYRDHVAKVHDDHQEVMIGYSDSGKDAGRLAAAWALYKCQESLVEVCKKHGVKLTLFHGRGGTVGRGGGPMLLAVQNQPPGSIQGSFRITEQGEMVQQKFGVPAVASRQMEIYTTAVLLATLNPPDPAKCSSWRSLMDKVSDTSCKAYRSVVFENPTFIKYFQNATPQGELGLLNIGSRPTRRKAGGDVTTLRAIPWIFAWMQTRMVLPSWLGVGDALTAILKEEGGKTTLRDMYEHWPFFQSVIDLVEMTLSKADMDIAALYDQVLVTDPEEKALGESLRDNYRQTVKAVLTLAGHARLSDGNRTLRHLIAMRQPHVDPINILQAQVLKRLRDEPENERLKDLLLITINGISSGMRNTG